MAKRHIERIAQSASDSLRMKIDASDWDFARIFAKASGAGSSQFDLRYPPFGAFPEPALVDGTPTLINFVNPPSEIEIVIVATGAVINVVVELSRPSWINEETGVPEMREIRKRLEVVVDKLSDLVTETRKLTAKAK